MQEIQIELTDWPAENGAMLTWNPPWMFSLFIPLAWLSYQQAVWVWMVVISLLTLQGVIWCLNSLDSSGMSHRERLLFFVIPFLSFTILLL